MSKKKTVAVASTVACVLALAGCANQQGPAEPQSAGVKRAPADATPTQGATTVVGKAPDSKDTELIGKPAPNSKFAKLRFGMSPQQVMNTIGAPADTNTHETGKRWIPFYFGPDARRTEVVYPGEGCLTYTGGNIYGSGSNELIKIHVDPSGKCFNA